MHPIRVPWDVEIRALCHRKWWICNLMTFSSHLIELQVSPKMDTCPVSVYFHVQHKGCLSWFKQPITWFLCNRLHLLNLSVSYSNSDHESQHLQTLWEKDFTSYELSRLLMKLKKNELKFDVSIKWFWWCLSKSSSALFLPLL